jgi:serine/threonine protein kinase, bacterial
MAIPLLGTGPECFIVQTRLRLEVGAEPFPGLKLVQLRGRGGFADVWEARNELDEPIALKFISASKTTTTVKEVKSLQAIQAMYHPNILRTDRVWCVAGYIVIAMELADASLLDVLDAYQAEYKTPIPRKVLATYMQHAAAGLDHMNKQVHQSEGRLVGYQHCDVKPSNLLLSGDTVKLADFGLATAITAMHNPFQKCGTLDFAAPEIYRGDLTDRSDQFSLAVSYYYLLTGQFPFPEPPTSFKRKYSYDRPAPELSLVSREDRRVLERALNVSPERRWSSCREFVAEMELARKEPPAPSMIVVSSAS